VGRAIPCFLLTLLLFALTGCGSGPAVRDPGGLNEQVHDLWQQLRDEGIYMFSFVDGAEGLEIEVYRADQRALRKIGEILGDGTAVTVREQPELLFVRGVITAINPAGDKGVFGHLEIFVEGKEETDTAIDRAYIVVGDETMILRADERGYVALPYPALEVGQVVEVWVAGAVLQSLPPIAGAVKIVINN
jgi:hypothetical protein